MGGLFSIVFVTQILLLLVSSLQSPIMGFNPCNGFNCDMSSIGEATLRDLADAMATNGMLAAGYTWFLLDDGWQSPSRSTNGTIMANPTSFPSTMKALVDHVKKAGLSFGLYTCRGTTTCEGLPGSKGFEELDANTYASWGVTYVKSDSCAASEVHADALSDYSKMSSALATASKLYNTTIVFSLCGWWSWYASFGALPTPVGDTWRISTDVPNWERFTQNIEAAAAVANFTGPSKGWPDVDMISGSWSADQEQAHVSFIAVIGSPLLLSWDIRIPSGKSTLPLAAYLNSELIAIHQDNASSLVTHDTPYYYQRLRGGAPPGSLFAPVATGASCASSAAQFTFHPTSSSPPRGYFESVALPGYCLGVWDFWVGACVDPVGVQLVRCNDTSTGCPVASQQWVLGGSADAPTLANALPPWSERKGVSGSSSNDKDSVGARDANAPSSSSKNIGASLEGMPYPGPFLTHDSDIPSALYIQPLPSSNAPTPAQVWNTAVALVLEEDVNTTIQSAKDGSCLAASVLEATSVWARWLSNGDVALFLLNTGPSPFSVHCDANCLSALSRGVSPVVPAWSARNVWTHADAGTISTAAGYSSPVLPGNGGSLLLRLAAMK